MKINENHIKDIVGETIKKVIKENTIDYSKYGIDEDEPINDTPFNFISSEDEEDKLREYLMDLCTEGLQYFQMMKDALSENENNKNFEILTKKINNLCDMINDLWNE